MLQQLHWPKMHLQECQLCQAALQLKIKQSWKKNVGGLIFCSFYVLFNRSKTVKILFCWKFWQQIIKFCEKNFFSWLECQTVFSPVFTFCHFFWRKKFSSVFRTAFRKGKQFFAATFPIHVFISILPSIMVWLGLIFHTAHTGPGFQPVSGELH